MNQDMAASRLRLLQQEFLQLPARGPGDGRAATLAHSPALLNLRIVDHIDATVREAEQHVHTINPDAGPAPAIASRVYDWWRDSTPDLDAAAEQAREAVIYRQSLEHAIAAGDHKAVRKHPCPACGCWGLTWNATMARAACLSLDCVDKNGLSSTWELKRLAHEHVARENLAQSRAT